MNHAPGISPATASRPTRAVGGDAIIAAHVGSEGVGGADRDYRRLISGCMDLSVDFLAVCILAIVARGRHDNDSRVDQSPSRPAYWIVLIRTNCRSTQAHVNDPDIVSVLIERLCLANWFACV